MHVNKHVFEKDKSCFFKEILRHTKEIGIIKMYI